MGSYTIYNPEYAPNEHERQKGLLFQQLELAKLQAAIGNLKSGASTSLGGNDITSFFDKAGGGRPLGRPALSGLVDSAPPPRRPGVGAEYGQRRGT